MFGPASAATRSASNVVAFSRIDGPLPGRRKCEKMRSIKPVATSTRRPPKSQRQCPDSEHRQQLRIEDRGGDLNNAVGVGECRPVNVAAPGRHGHFFPVTHQVIQLLAHFLATQWYSMAGDDNFRLQPGELVDRVSGGFPVGGEVSRRPAHPRIPLKQGSQRRFLLGRDEGVARDQ